MPKADQRRMSALRALLRYHKGMSMKYAPQRVLGSGSFGTVYRVRGKKALKWVPDNARYREALERELLGLKMVDSFDNFVHLECVVRCRGEQLMVLELCDMDLRCYVLARQKLPKAQAMTLLDGLLSALDYLDICGCIHRDIKPDNLLMKGDYTLKVADLGAMRLPYDDEDEDEDICCTIPFCAPEWLLGKADYGSAVDVWGAGLVMHFMLTGNFFTYWMGFSRIETLLRIFQALGTPTEATWPGVTALPHFDAAWPRFTGHFILEPYLSGLLEPCPERRWTAGNALSKLRVAKRLVLGKDGLLP